MFHTRDDLIASICCLGSVARHLELIWKSGFWNCTALLFPQAALTMVTSRVLCWAVLLCCAAAAPACDLVGPTWVASVTIGNEEQATLRLDVSLVVEYDWTLAWSTTTTPDPRELCTSNTLTWHATYDRETFLTHSVLDYDVLSCSYDRYGCLACNDFVDGTTEVGFSPDCQYLYIDDFGGDSIVLEAVHEEEKEGLTGGQIAGIVVGVVVGLGALVAVIAVVSMRYRPSLYEGIEQQ